MTSRLILPGMEKRPIVVSEMGEQHSNARCAGCGEWSVVLVFFRKLVQDVPICESSKKLLTEQLEDAD